MFKGNDTSPLRIALLGPPPAGLATSTVDVDHCDAPGGLAALARRGRVDVVLVATGAWPEAERELAAIDPALNVLRHVPGETMPLCMLEHAAGLRRQEDELARARLTPTTQWTLTGDSDAMAGLRGRIRQVADSPSPVIVAGATGTPLEAAAALLHAHAGGGPLLTVDLRRPDAATVLCGCSGSSAAVALAAGGSLLVQHVDAADEVVAAMLTALSQGRWQRAGDLVDRPVSCRLIGTVQRDPALPGTVSAAAGLPEGWAAKVIRVPTLLERADDIPMLTAQHMAGEDVMADPGVAHDYPWPGNDQELTLRCTLAALSQQAPSAGALVCDGDSTLADLERQAVLATLRAQGGHRRRTAAALGIGLRTLGVKLSQWRKAQLLPPGI
ncbi:MAG: hypothetical protein MK074_00800 [Phycisphaerales bacterium]|nr:hypothetical protein [Phycisphaerales bacterium]